MREAPEFIDGEWINSPPISLANLRGKVVLIDFWEYSCINCIRTLPYIKSWYEKYADKGLEIIGVHTPEFDFGKDPENVKRAIERFRIRYPVVSDPERTIWDEYRNMYWPREFLVDAKGIIRYDHAGEGGYANTEAHIQELLREAKPGVILPELSEPAGAEVEGAVCYPTSPEIYLGFERGTLGNPEGYLTGKSEYRDPGNHANGKYYLSGTWLTTPQFVQHGRVSTTPEDYIAIKYHAMEVNAVMGANGISRVYVKQYNNWLENKNKGKDVKFDEEGRSYVDVSEARMYNIVKSPTFGMHELQLLPLGDDIQVFTFTFGSCPIL